MVKQLGIDRDEAIAIFSDLLRDDEGETK